MDENNVAAVKMENEVSISFNIRFRIKSRVKYGCVLFPFIRNVLIDFVLRKTGKAMGEHESKWEEDLYYADDLIILDESVSRTNELLEI